jgi:hypothetical protein
MRLWNANKIRPTHLKEPKLKALARTVRDWLNVFIDEAEDSAMGRNPATTDLGKTAANAVEGNEFRSDSSGREQDGAFRWNGLQPVGPPEDWLRRVREGAPGLLRSVEDGGVPWANSRRQANENNEPQQGAISGQPFSGESLRQFPATAAPGANECREAGTREPIDVPRPTSWFQSLRKHLMPSSMTLRKEKIRLQPRLVPSTPESPARPLGVVTPTPVEQKLNDEITQRYRRAPQSAAIEFERPAVSTISHWVERLRRTIRAVFPGEAANLSLAKPRDGQEGAHSKNEKLFPTTSGTPRPVPARVPERQMADRPDLKFDNVSSRPPASLRLDPRSNWSGERQGGSRPQVNDVSELPPKQPSWPSVSASVENFQNPISERARISPRNSRNDEAYASQPLHQLLVDSVNGSVNWPESPRSDLWPELPAEIPRETTSPTLFLRNAERLRALDIEQRGGR